MIKIRSDYFCYGSKFSINELNTFYDQFLFLFIALEVVSHSIHFFGLDSDNHFICGTCDINDNLQIQIEFRRINNSMLFWWIFNM